MSTIVCKESTDAPAVGQGLPDTVTEDNIEGSTFIFDNDNKPQAVSGAKAYLLNGDGTIILLPTPSNDPADPLNWTLSRKWMIIAFLVLWSSAALAVQAFLGNYLPSLAEKYPDEPYNNIVLLYTITVPMIAPGEMLFVPLAVTYGRRLAILVACLLLFVSTMWGAYSGSFKSLLGARIVEGLAGGPTDAIFITVIQEFTYVHERGHMMGATIMAQLALPTLFAIVTNYMALVAGFKWPFIMFACIAAVAFIGLFLFMPETRYKRHINSDQHEVTLKEHRMMLREITSSATHSEYGLQEQLKIFVGRGSGDDSKFFNIYKSMGILVLNPIIWWIALLNTVSTGSYTALSTIYASMLVIPPWSWPATNVGLITLTVVPAGIMNWFLLGWYNDKLLLWMAKRNKGVVVPENRLILLIIPVSLMISANIGFGALAQRYLVTNVSGSQPHWFSLAFLVTLFIMGFGGILEITYTYLSTTVKPVHSLAAMTVVSVIRDMASFGMSYGVTSFAANCGYQTSFGIYGLLVGFIGLGGVPVYLYGEKLRLRYVAAII